jgi:hypothetical protein
MSIAVNFLVWCTISAFASNTNFVGPAGPFSLVLRPSYHLDWEISPDGVLNATMSTNTSNWLGFGLSPTAFLTFHGMNNADIVVASWNSSESAKCDVEDMFNDSNFEGAPKRDVDIGGTDDVLGFSCAVVQGWTKATFTRKLLTGDKRDWEIKDGYNHVIIAHGKSRSFGYHGKNSTGTCKVNFFDGTLQEPCKVFWS